MEMLLKTLTDPICNRIIQMLRVRGNMTIAELLAAAPELSRATVYRKMEKMLEMGAVCISETRKVRGQTEHRYAIGTIWIGSPETGADCEKLVTWGLMQICDQYSRYFMGGDVDADRDKLFLSNYSICLNDVDFSEMLQKITAVLDSYQQKSDAEGARLRSLYFLSAPGGEDHETK